MKAYCNRDKQDNENGSQTIEFMFAFPLFIFLTLLIWQIGGLAYSHDSLQGTLNEVSNQAGQYTFASNTYGTAYSVTQTSSTCTGGTEGQSIANITQVVTEVGNLLVTQLNPQTAFTVTAAAGYSPSDPVCTITLIYTPGSGFTVSDTSGDTNVWNVNGPEMLFITLSAPGQTQLLGMNYTDTATATVDLQQYHCFQLTFC